MKNIYPESKNPFAGKKIVNFKKSVVYPYSGNIRFLVKLDKNGQVYEVLYSYAKTIVDPETKKRYVKLSTGARPKDLFNRIKGKPFELACPWIDNFIEHLNSKEE